MTFKDLPGRVVRRLRRKHDRLVLESCPLHTERPEWAAHAPAQVDAACKRGADVIAFSEVHGPLAHQLASVAAKNGYAFFHNADDVALAYKMTLDNANAGNLPVHGTRSMAFVSFDFHGSRVTVLGFHLMTVKPSQMAQRAAQIGALVAEMAEVSHDGEHLGFFLADSNPSKPMHEPSGEPRHSLDAAGLLLANEELNEWPTGLGVTTVGRNRKDGRVKAVKAVLGAALGSDHRPLTVTYRVLRRR